ncbi:hypothetical protein Tco_1283031 [Tanacetum coccineum]
MVTHGYTIPQTAQEECTSVIKMSVHVNAEENTNKKNDAKARSLLLMALPNEHQLTFSQYSNAKTMFAAIETRFGGNEATKKTQKTLLKQQYENFSASSTESLDSICNRLQKIADIETMSIDDLYNNFKIVKQDVKKSIGASSGAQNLAFMTAPSTSSTNDINIANPAYEVSTVSPKINTACPQDLEQIHEDDLEAMDLKWQLSVLKCFNYHKMGYFAKECRAPRNKEGQFKYQDNTRKQGNNEDTSSKAMLAIDGAHCKYHQRERMVYGNNYNRVNYNYTTNRTHPNAQRNMVSKSSFNENWPKRLNTVSIKVKSVSSKLLPPKKQIHSPSSSSTTLSNSSRNQTCDLVSPSFSVYTPTQIFEIGKSSIKIHLKHQEEQIEDILNYLEELSFHHIEKMEEGRINRMIIRRNGNELKTELKRIRTQIIKLQKKQLGQRDKIAFAHYRISNLEQIIEEIQARHQTDQEDL